MDVVAIIISSTIVYAIPLMLGALAGMFSERSGVVNIALEGLMILGSLFGAIFITKVFANSAFATNSPQLAVVITMLVSGASGVLFSMLLAYAAINLKADQIISGTALNIFAPAFAVVLAYSFFGLGISSQTLPRLVKWNAASFGLDPNAMISWVNILVFQNLYITTPIAILVVIIAFVVLYKTKFGLRLRACGEHPQAADSVGINVVRMRYIGVMISGFLAGIAGFAFSLANATTHNPSVLGYGFLALAVMIFGNWKPFRILFAALFFFIL